MGVFREQEDIEEEEENEPEPEEEEWVSEEEYAVFCGTTQLLQPKKRGRRSQMSESEEDEEYGSNKKRRILPIKKIVKPRINLSEEPAGMKALRQYTSALKLGYNTMLLLNYQTPLFPWIKYHL